MFDMFFYFIVFIFGLIVGSFLNCLIYRLALPSNSEGGRRRFIFFALPNNNEGGRRKSIFFALPNNSEGGRRKSIFFALPNNSEGGRRKSIFFALPNFSLKNLGGFKNRSYCPHCKHLLSWQDLIPVFSFMFLKGKCRYCQEKISLQYPLVELATGILFVLVLQLTINNFTPTPNFGVGASQLTIFSLLNFCYLLIITSFLIVIFVYDLKHYIIPDQVIYPAIAIALIFNFFTPTPNFGVGASFLMFNEFSIHFTFDSKQFSIFNYSILSAILAAAFFLAIVLISREKWMGVGDIKLAFFMGLILGWPNILVALFLAFFIGAAVGVGLIISNQKTLKSEIPFGPFLVTGTFLAFFWGNELINWYQGLFLLR